MSTRSKKRVPHAALMDAARNMDWMQVALNVTSGSAPCFHLDNGRYCLRGERWPGHPKAHKFVPLHALIDLAANTSTYTVLKALKAKR